MATDFHFGRGNEGGADTNIEINEQINQLGKSNSNDAPQVHLSLTGPQVEKESMKTKKDRLISRERYIHPPPPTVSPSHRNANSLMARNSLNRVQKTTTGSHLSREASPLDPRILPGSSSWTPGGLNQSNLGSVSTTPVQSKLISSKESDSERGGVIPPLGMWDPDDPFGEKLTGKFQRLRSAKKENSEKVPPIDVEPHKERGRYNKFTRWFCCLCRTD